MQRRTMGNEHEYMLTETPHHDTDLAARRLLSNLSYVIPLTEVMRQRKVANDFRFDQREPLDWYAGRHERTDMLINQARAYVDTPNAEYATQECDNVLDLVACEKAGEKLFMDALVKLRTALQDIRPHAIVRLFKNNRAFKSPTDDDEDIFSRPGSLVSDMASYAAKFASCGTHDNYMIDSHATRSRLQQLFIPHLIALSVFAGGGCVEYDAEKKKFVFSRSQRFPWIYTPIGTSTKGARNFLVFRQGETFADSEKYRRMQVISGDANLFESALLLKHATSVALLEMLEDDSFFERVLQPELEHKFSWAMRDNELAYIAGASSILSLDDPLPTDTYRWTLRSLAAYFAELRQRYDELVGFSEDRRAGLRLEQELLKQLARVTSGDESLILAPYSDHAFMRQVVEHDMEQHRYTYRSNPKRVMDFPAKNRRTVKMNVSNRFRYIEAMCHEIDPESRFERAQASGFVRRIVKPEAIGAMITGTPLTTRANRRKIIADELARREDLGACRWTGVTACTVSDLGFCPEYRLEDPFESELTPEDRKYLYSEKNKTAD